MIHVHQIKAAFMTVGVVFEDSYVIQAAPIIRYMVGWDLHRVEQYCDKRGWEMEKVS